MQNPDREIRKNAFERGNEAWDNISDICAQALNSIAGTRLTINRNRGIDNFLDQSLKESRISQKSLDAMFKAIEENSDFARRLGFAKARIMGLKGLTWYDFEAPVEIPGLESYSWEQAVKLVDNAFSHSIPELGDFFRMAIKNNWVEAEPRKGKMPGAFCTGSILTEESRVFMTHSGSLGDVSTLAHEIGHAFHSYLMKGMRPNLKHYPMTLAEAASTFGEMLLADGIINDPDISDSQKLNILTQELNHGMAFLIDIPIRFMFEKSFYEERKNSEVSVARLKELMSNAMKEKFGNLLIDNGEDPYFWASKMHFYLTDASFYNYPYSFGYLLSRGLYTMFKQDRDAFLPKYREFLRRSGSDYAHIVAQETIGANLEDTAFWKASILSHEPELEMFEKLSAKVLK
jgi:oligoendopeptidase F